MARRHKVPLEGYEPLGDRRITGGTKEQAILIVGLTVVWIIVHMLQPDSWQQWAKWLTQILALLVFVVLVHWYCMDDESSSRLLRIDRRYPLLPPFTVGGEQNEREKTGDCASTSRQLCPLLRHSPMRGMPRHSFALEPCTMRLKTKNNGVCGLHFEY